MDSDYDADDNDNDVLVFLYGKDIEIGVTSLFISCSGVERKALVPLSYSVKNCFL